MSTMAPPTYIITDMGALPGASHCLPYDIAPDGTVVGGALTPEGQFHAVIHSPGLTPNDPSGSRLRVLAAVGWQASIAMGIDAALRSVGSFLSSDGSTRACLWTGNRVVDLGTLGGRNSAAEAIVYAPSGSSLSGWIVGEAETVNGVKHAFVFDGQRLLDLGTLGGQVSGAKDINVHGQVVGVAATSDHRTHAFLYENGLMHDLGTLGGRSSVANAVSSAGTIVGVAELADGSSHAFLYADGAMRDLGTLGGAKSAALDINSHDETVGISLTGGARSHAFIHSDSMFDLNGLIAPDSGWELIGATAINDGGKIAGYGRYQGQTRAFTLTRVVR